MVRLTIPAQLCFKELAFAAVLAAVDAEAGAPDAEARDQIVSALGEALNNVVLHAYRGVRGGHIELDVRAEPGELEIRIQDRGRGFDPPEISPFDVSLAETWGVELDAAGEPAFDPDRLPESGMGLFIMRSFMDEVSYTRGGNGRPNLLVLRKRWAPAKEAIVRPAAPAQPPPGDGAPRALDAGRARREASQSGWRIRSVAMPSSVERIAGSLKRK